MSILVLLLYSGYAWGKDDDQAEQVVGQRGPQHRGQQPGVDRVADEPIGARGDELRLGPLGTARLPPRRAPAIAKTRMTLTPVSCLRRPPRTLCLLLAAEASQ